MIAIATFIANALALVTIIVCNLLLKCHLFLPNCFLNDDSKVFGLYALKEATKCLLYKNIKRYAFLELN